MTSDKQEWPIDRRHGERRKQLVTPDSNGNTKWLMGIFAALVAGAALGWSGNVNRSIEDLRPEVAVLKVRVEVLSTEVSKLSRLLEQDRAEREAERRRGK